MADKAVDKQAVPAVPAWAGLTIRAVLQASGIRSFRRNYKPNDSRISGRTRQGTWDAVFRI